MLVRPARRICGRVTVPGDKSISHRAALIAALAKGTSRIENYSTSADCAATLLCLQKLGVRIERAGNQITIQGGELSAPQEPLDSANSGTTMRLLAGILAGQNFESTLTGDESLRSRPMQRIIEPLEMMGAEITATDGRAPFKIRGRRPLQPIDYKLLVASAQVKSCILLAGLFADGRTAVTETEPTRDHTERMLKWFGVPVQAGATAERENGRVAVVFGPSALTPTKVTVPGDISSAAYFIAAAALLPESSLEIANIGVNPTRISFVKQLQNLGHNIAIANSRKDCNEAIADIVVCGSRESNEGDEKESPLKIDGLAIPQLIDELPLLAVVGSQIEGGIEIRNAKELRVKESDRIASTTENLRAMGAMVEELDDGLKVGGPSKLRGAQITSRGDHRIAMAFTVAALIADGESDIDDHDCVGISFPGFFKLLESVIER